MINMRDRVGQGRYRPFPPYGRYVIVSHHTAQASQRLAHDGLPAVVNMKQQQQGQGYTFDKVRYSILNNRAIFGLTLL